MNADQRTEVTELSRAGVAPRAIATATVMRNSKCGVPVLVRDIYNVKMQLKTETLAGKTPIQALIAQFNVEELH